MSDLITDTHVYFYGGILSQWYRCEFTIKGYTYNCAEQFMMHCKAMMFGDGKAATAIMNSISPREQKFFGRKVIDFDVNRWNKIAINIVTAGNFAKFSQNTDLKEYLLNTENKILVEASPTDKIWGVGLSKDDPKILCSSNWLGTNWLGECLMNARDIIKSNPNGTVELGYIVI